MEEWMDEAVLAKIEGMAQRRLIKAGELLKGKIEKRIESNKLVSEGGGDHLKDAVEIRAVSPTTIQVGIWSKPYAAIHEFGGIIKQTVTKKQRGFFFAKAKEAGAKKKKR
jgi:phage gpG-like protein